MNLFSSRTTRRRIVAAASASAIALVGVAVVAPSAEATVTPRTYTAVMSPVVSEHGASADYSVTVTNTSTKISALDRFLLTVPEGFVVDPLSLGADRSGWSVTLQSDGAKIKATTSKPIRYGVRKGDALAVSFSAKAPFGCAAATVSWPVYADGVLLPFSLQGAAPSSSIRAVAGTCTTVVGVPGTKIPVADLTIPGAGQADLGSGANGPVSLTVQACTADATCTKGSELELLGSFKDAQGNPLYDYDNPASISRVCTVDSNTTGSANCRHQVPGLSGTEGEGDGDYRYNYFCTSSCAGYGQPFGEREVEEDFQWHPTYVSINGGAFTLAGRCVPLPESNSDPNKAALLELTGKITDPAAQAAGFCVDVNAITRANNSFAGDLTIPVLFVEDIKLRP